MDTRVSFLYSWEIVLWTEATRGRVGFCVARLSRHLRYDLPDRSGVLFFKAIKLYIGNARCSSRTLTLINVVALSPANTEANLLSTTTTTTECRVQAGRGVGLNNRPNGERGVRPLHNKSFVLHDKLDSWSFQVHVWRGGFHWPVRSRYWYSHFLLLWFWVPDDTSLAVFYLPPTLDPTRNAVRTLALSPTKLCTLSTRKTYHLTTACFVFMTFDFYSYPKGSPSTVYQGLYVLRKCQGWS